MSNLTLNPGVSSSLCEIMRRPAFPTTRLTIGKLLDVNNNAFASLHQSLQQLQNQSQLNELTHSLSQNHCHQQLEHLVSSSTLKNGSSATAAHEHHSSSSNINGNNPNSNCIAGNSSNGYKNNNSSICNSDAANNRRDKRRYSCSKCPYATDRRDLFTRHENIHRDEKPFRCYVCNKMFNRADHVKKHFLRIHKGLEYDVKLTKRVKGIDYDTNENHTPSSVNLNTNNLSGLMRDQLIHDAVAMNGNKFDELIGSANSLDDLSSRRNNSTSCPAAGKNQVTENSVNASVNSLYTRGLVNHILDQQKQHREREREQYEREQYVSPVGHESKSSIVRRLNEWTSAAAAVGCLLSDREEGEIVSVNPLLTSGPVASCSSLDVQSTLAQEKGGRVLHEASGELEEGRSTIRCTGAYEAHSPESFCLLSPANSPCDSAESSSSPSSPSSPCSLSPSSPSSPPSTSASSSTSQDVRAVDDKKSIIVPTTTSSRRKCTPRASSTLPLHSSRAPLSSLRSLPLPPPPPPPPPPPAAASLSSPSSPSSVSSSPSSPLSSHPPPPPPPPLDASTTANTALLLSSSSSSSSSASSSCKRNPSNGTPLAPNSSCNYESLASNALRVNLAAKLNAKSNYECEECGCNFVDYASLHTHRYLLHEYIGNSSNCLPYTCVVCGVKTHTQRSMIQHMTIHSFIGRKIHSSTNSTALGGNCLSFSSTLSPSSSSLFSRDRVSPNPASAVSIGHKTSIFGAKRKRLLVDIADMVKLKSGKKCPSQSVTYPHSPLEGQLCCVTADDSIRAKSDHSSSNPSSSSTRRKQLVPRKILKKHLSSCESSLHY